jgi:hypothetical protein
MIRVIGCDAWVFIPKEFRPEGKLSPKAVKMTHNGRSKDSKGCRFIDLSTKKVVESRNALFN